MHLDGRYALLCGRAGNRILTTIIESNGPDRFNLTPGCASHNAGVRTGIKDYCCCCDPCQYVRDADDPARMSERLCCRCTPKFILAKFTPDDTGDPCCKKVAVAMAAAVWSDNSDQNVVRYSGDLVGHAVYVYLSNDYVDYGVSRANYTEGCRWTIRIDSLGIHEEIAIDHVTVTCLGVPSISVTGVTGLGSCVGSITLTNYVTDKVPFHKREFDSYFADGYTMMLPLPYGVECEGCTEIPRFICVSRANPYTAIKRQPTAAEKLADRSANFWKEFQWDVDWEYTYNSYVDEQIVGRWRHFPDDPTAFVESLYLVQDQYGTCWLQPDFVEPATADGEGEVYERTQLTNCGCQFKILNVRPVNDLSDTPSNRDGNGIDYRIGRCTCWGFVCGNRRCVNRYFCGFLFVNRTLYQGILFTWNSTDKCWYSSGGVDPYGHAMPFDLSICLESDGRGGCQLQASYGGYGGYTISPIAIDDETTILSATFNGVNATSDDFLTLFVNTSFDGECDYLIHCDQATPCAGECGSHPTVLFASFRGWSEPYDGPSLPSLGECSTEVTMSYYWQVVSILDGQISYICGYIGYAVVSGQYLNPDTSMFEVREFLLQFRLTMGAMTVTRRLLSDPTTVLVTTVIDVTESCDPYYGFYNSYDRVGALLTNCFFGDNSVFFYRYTLDITE